MKKLLLIALAGLFAFAGCKQAQPEKTIANLKWAYEKELTASVRYAAYALKAQEEGYEAIAKLFNAVSKSDGIHAENHLKALEAHGVTMEEVTPQYETLTTLENLELSIKGESIAIEEKFPQYLAEATEEKVDEAKLSFLWVIETEKAHHVFFSKAHESLKAAADATLPAVVLPEGYAVCPTCGHIYDIAAQEEICAFCDTEKASFLIF